MSDTPHIHREVLRLAIPAIFASITVPLVGIVDTAIVGHIADASAIGGIAISSMIFNILYWFFGFLRVGTSGMVAQAYGRGDKETQGGILLQAIGICFAGALLLWAIQWPVYHGILKVIPASESVAQYSHDYFFIRIWAAPATLLLFTAKGFFIGEQNTMASLVCDLTVNIVNIIASLVLALYTKAGAMGVAYGTVIAQYTGVAVAGVICAIRYRDIAKAGLRHAADKMAFKATLRSYASLNSDLVIRNLCFMVVYVGFTAIASQYGDEELAVSSIMMQLFMVFSYFCDGFAYAAEAMVGRFVGEKNPTLIRMTVREVHLWGVVIGTVFTLLFIFRSDDMIGLISDDASVLTTAQPYYIWLMVMPYLSSLAFLWDGVFTGATDGKTMRNSMIGSVVFFVLVYWVGHGYYGMHALYAAYMAHLVFRSAYMTVLWPYKFKQWTSTLSY